MKRRLARFHSTWRALWRRRELDAEIRDEMRFHIGMETERLMNNRGLDRP
jgi:hypothetical protein